VTAAAFGAGIEREQLLPGEVGDVLRTDALLFLWNPRR